MSSPQEQLAAQMKALGIAIPEGWAGLDATNPANDEAKKRTALERYQRAKIIADGISAEALDLLRSVTIEDPTWQVHELGLVNAIGFGIMREGQNSLVRWIETQKRIAEQGPTGEGAPQHRRGRKG